MTYNNYRKIYESFFGAIPVDDTGRTYDIHHINGNKKDNSRLNLIALSIHEHFFIHWLQKEYKACHAIALRMNKSHEELSNLAKGPKSEEHIKNLRIAQQKYFSTHSNHFKGKKHSEKTKQLIREKRKLQICSDETRQKMSNTRKGMPQPWKRKPRHKDQSTGKFIKL